MQPDTMEAAPAAPESIPEAPPEAAFQNNVLTLLEGMQAGLAALAARVDKVEGTQPQFIRQTVEELSEVEDVGQEHLKAMREAIPDGQARFEKIPTFSDGLRVHDFVMDQYKPKFRESQRVRINLDAVPYGRDDGRTRRDLKLADGTPDGPGEVITIQFLSKTGVWKYRCKFPSKVLPGSNGGVTSFYEPELLPA